MHSKWLLNPHMQFVQVTTGILNQHTNRDIRKNDYSYKRNDHDNENSKLRNWVLISLGAGLVGYGFYKKIGE